jgi:hypothetical protein
MAPLFTGPSRALSFLRRTTQNGKDHLAGKAGGAMLKQSVTFILILAFVGPLASQPQPSIQGVWRESERTIPASVAGRQDPFGAFPAGTHTSLQPTLVIFTDRHYSRTSDTAAQPRPTTGYKTPGKPTLEELQAEWGPFAANAGTYEVSGTTLTLHAIVAKNPRAQREKELHPTHRQAGWE